MTFHESVLLQEVLDYLEIKPGDKYIDATLGGGGHSVAIARKGGLVLGLDVDPDAIAYVHHQVAVEDNLHISVFQDNFTHLEKVAKYSHFNNVSGVLFDLGVSSHQVDTPERGFSFQYDHLLDMRMDPNLAVTAKDLINGLNVGELRELFTKYGEEKWAAKIAKDIVASRLVAPIETTGQLAKIVEQTVGFKGSRIHPATRVFQSLRIAVNDELNSLKEALPQALEILAPGGKLIVISFHSLEDRIVKNYFKEEEDKGAIRILTDKPVVPTNEEIERNPRSRSAKLRVAVKN